MMIVEEYLNVRKTRRRRKSRMMVKRKNTVYQIKKRSVRTIGYKNYPPSLLVWISPSGWGSSPVTMYHIRVPCPLPTPSRCSRVRWTRCL
jgi:hypothetical protein